MRPILASFFVPAVIPSAVPARRESSSGTVNRDRWESSRSHRLAALCDGLDELRRYPARMPHYEAGSHPHWRDRTDHCYSLLFRVAIARGLLRNGEAERLMASIPAGNPAGFRAVMFPEGHTRVPLAIEGSRVRLDGGAIPRGHLVSLDGGAHVMVSTGRVRPDGRHEVYSFKGGEAATPVWGDAPDRDFQARIHILTIEDELENLLRDDQDLTAVYIATGPSVLSR